MEDTDAISTEIRQNMKNAYKIRHLERSNHPNRWNRDSPCTRKNTFAGIDKDFHYIL